MGLPTVQNILPDWPGWASLEPSYGDQASGQGSGEMIVKQLRDPLWTLHAESRPLKPNALRFWKATLAGLDNGRKLFLGYDFASSYPVKYPNGAWAAGPFDGTNATLNSIAGDGVSITLAGLPAGYTGSIGDMLSITYGDGDPAALCLVQAVQAFVASGGGVTPQFEVRGALPAGLTVGDAVAVKRPSCHMMITPGSITLPKDISGGGIISFDGFQVPTP